MLFEFLLPFDLSVAKAADRLRTLCGAFLTPVFKGITLCGNLGLIFILSALVMLFFRKTRASGTAALIALAFGALFTNVILKRAIARDRPFADPSSGFYVSNSYVSLETKGGVELKEVVFVNNKGVKQSATVARVKNFFYVKDGKTYGVKEETNFSEFDSAHNPSNLVDEQDKFDK